MEEQKNNTKTMTKAEKVQANLSAVKLVKALEADNRLADSAEQEILSNYVGWGGLANDFFDSKINRFAKERDELKRLVTKEEYRAIEMSSLTAYYTSPEIATAMWDKIVESGFKGGNILDPSMGFRVIIMIQANSQVNTRVLELLPKFKIKKMNRWCAV